MDGKGRATDNAFIERLWRNIKYKKIYLNPPKDGLDLYLMVNEYFDYYNNERRHESLDYERSPKAIERSLVFSLELESHKLANKQRSRLVCEMKLDMDQQI